MKLNSNLSNANNGVPTKSKLIDNRSLGEKSTTDLLAIQKVKELIKAEQIENINSLLLAKQNKVKLELLLERLFRQEQYIIGLSKERENKLLFDELKGTIASTENSILAESKSSEASTGLAEKLKSWIKWFNEKDNEEGPKIYQDEYKNAKERGREKYMLFGFLKSIEEQKAPERISNIFFKNPILFLGFFIAFIIFLILQLL